MKDFIKPEVVNKNRQELPVFYRLNGAVYLAYWDYLKEHASFFGKEIFAYIMPQEKSMDIDNEVDLKLARILIKQIRRKSFLICLISPVGSEPWYEEMFVVLPKTIDIVGIDKLSYELPDNSKKTHKEGIFFQRQRCKVAYQRRAGTIA